MLVQLAITIQMHVQTILVPINTVVSTIAVTPQTLVPPTGQIKIGTTQTIVAIIIIAVTTIQIVLPIMVLIVGMVITRPMPVRELIAPTLLPLVQAIKETMALTLAIQITTAIATIIIAITLLTLVQITPILAAEEHTRKVHGVRVAELQEII